MSQISRKIVYHTLFKVFMQSLVLLNVILVVMLRYPMPRKELEIYF